MIHIFGQAAVIANVEGAGPAQQSTPISCRSLLPCGGRQLGGLANLVNSHLPMITIHQ
jgi:hypothetical protein